VLTISRLSRWSINYYRDTAQQASQAGLDRQQANGGLGEYYCEGDTRTPTWLIVGDTARAVELVGVDGRAVDGGAADPERVQRWLDDGIAPTERLDGPSPRAVCTGSISPSRHLKVCHCCGTLRGVADARPRRTRRPTSLAVCARQPATHSHGWYRNHDRLHTGDQIAMAADATTAYIAARTDGKDVAILCDTWEIADAINQTTARALHQPHRP